MEWLNCIKDTGGIGIGEAADAGNLMYIGTEAEAYLAHTFRLLPICELLIRILSKQAPEQIRQSSQDDLIPEGRKIELALPDGRTEILGAGTHTFEIAIPKKDK